MGFRGVGFSPTFSLLKPTFSLLHNPHLLSLMLLFVQNAPLPLVNNKSTASVGCLAPFIFGAGSLDQ